MQERMQCKFVRFYIKKLKKINCKIKKRLIVNSLHLSNKIGVFLLSNGINSIIVNHYCVHIIFSNMPLNNLFCNIKLAFQSFQLFL